ncbi:unnamed protein product [Sphacelaria rigidula]
MVNVRHKWCGEEGCPIYPSFGAAFGRKAEFCAEHAPAGMVDVRHKRCGEEGCSNQPSLGAAGGGKVEFCATHAPAGFGDGRNKRCGEEGCSNQPSFGAAAGGKAEFCATHARPGMVDVRSKRCGKEDCSKYPSFVEARGMKAFCTTHACASSMIGSEYALQPSLTRVREHEIANRHGSHDVAMACDTPGRVRETSRLNHDSAVGENGVGITGHQGSSHRSDADPDTKEGECDAHSRHSPRAIRVERRRAKFLNTSPAASGQFPGAVVAYEIPLGGAQARMKVELEATITSRGVFEGIGTSGELDTALSSSCINMSNGGSSSTAINGGCGGSITSERNTKRLRRTLRVEPLFDVTAGDRGMAEKRGADVKLELDVSARYRQVSAAVSGTRDLLLDVSAPGHPYPG